MKRFLTILLAILMLLSTFGCGQNETKDNVRPTTANIDTNSLTIGLSARLNTLDPYHAILNDEVTITGYIHQQLFVTDKDGNVVLDAAESMTLAEDGSYVEFKLKEGQMYASGDAVTADDVEYSVQRGIESAAYVVLGTYTAYEKIDELTFRLNFTDPETVGFDTLAPYIEAIVIVNKSYLEGNGYAQNDDTLFDVDGSGPFMLDSINEASGDVTLKRNPNYTGEVGLDSIYGKIITGDPQLAFEAGEIDICTYTPTQFKSIENLTNVAYKYDVRNYIGFLVFNCTESFPTSDINVRMGLAYALNREDIATVATDGAGETAYNMCNPTVAFYSDVCDHYERDLEKSKQLLSEAGYSEENPYEVEIITIGSQQEWVNACQIIKENLEESYVKVTITALADTSRYFMADFDMAIIGVSLIQTVPTYASLFDEQQFNLAGIPGEDAGPIIDACMAGTTEEAAHKAMKMIVDFMAYYPLYYTTSYTCYDDRLDLGAAYDQLAAYRINEITWNK